MAGVAAITEREIALISRFIELLQQEQEMLKRADASSLHEVGTAKAELAEQLNALEIDRRLTLGVSDQNDLRKAMASWLKANPNDRSAADNWQKLLELAAQARQLHELNAGLVAMHLQQTNEALAILTQQPKRSALYGSDGQTAPSSGSRIIDSA